MNNFPKITVVTPCFNMVRYIETTILSVLGQKYPNLEYIIIDGGSSDGTIDIIRKYESKLHFWKSEPDKGMYDAIQKGFDNSSGEIMCWLNADDIFLPNALFSIATLFSRHEKCNWIEGNNTICDENGTLINAKIPNEHTRYNFLLNKHMNGGTLKSFGTIQQESTFWRRSLWEKAGSALRTDLKYGGDFELWMRFFRFSELYSTSVMLSAFRSRQEQNSVKFRSEYLKEISKVLEMERKKLTDDEWKMIRFIKRIDKIPILIKSEKIKNKYIHYTKNSILAL